MFGSLEGGDGNKNDEERGGNIIPFPGKNVRPESAGFRHAGLPDTEKGARANEDELEEDTGTFHQIAFDIMSRTEEFIDKHPELDISDKKIEEETRKFAALYGKNIAQLEGLLETILSEDGADAAYTASLEDKDAEEILWRVAVSSAYLELHDRDKNE